MYDPDADAPPFNPLPAVIVILSLAIGAVEAVFQLGEAGIIGGQAAKGWRLEIGTQFGIYNAALSWMWETGSFTVMGVLRLVTYPFVHGSLATAVFSIVFVLALGKFVAERVHWIGVLAVFFGSGFVGAVGFVLYWPPQTLLLGAGAATYGLVGAFTWLRFLELRFLGKSGARAFLLFATLAALNVLFAVLFDGNEWLDHLLGAAAGLGICAFLRPQLGQNIEYWLKRTRGR